MQIEIKKKKKDIQDEWHMMPRDNKYSELQNPQNINQSPELTS